MIDKHTGAGFAVFVILLSAGLYSNCDCIYSISEIVMDYFNDPELNGKYLGTITKDFVVVSDSLTA